MSTDPQTQTPRDAPDDQPEQVDEEQQFLDEQAAKARAQNQLTEGAVPEQRPIASQTVDSSVESETFQALRDAGDPRASNEPMGKEAYDRAQSDEQADKAAENSRTDGIRTGAAITITNDKPGQHGRNAVIQSCHYDAENAALLAAGTDESRYAMPESCIVRTRDGRSDTFELKPDEFKVVAAELVGATAQNWGRSQV